MDSNYCPTAYKRSAAERGQIILIQGATKQANESLSAMSRFYAPNTHLSSGLNLFTLSLMPWIIHDLFRDIICTTSIKQYSEEASCFEQVGLELCCRSHFDVDLSSWKTGPLWPAGTCWYLHILITHSPALPGVCQAQTTPFSLSFPGWGVS